MDRAAPPSCHFALQAPFAIAGWQFASSATLSVFVALLLTAAHVGGAIPCALALPLVGRSSGTAFVAILALDQGPGVATIAAGLMLAYRELEARAHFPSWNARARAA